MLPPMTPAARASFRQAITISATNPPHASPSNIAVANSRRKAVANQLQVNRAERKAWIVTLIDCALTLSVKPSTIVRKNAITRLRASVASKSPARTALIVPAVTVTRSHGNR